MGVAVAVTAASLDAAGWGFRRSYEGLQGRDIVEAPMVIGGLQSGDLVGRAQAFHQVDGAEGIGEVLVVCRSHRTAHGPITGAMCRIGTSAVLAVRIAVGTMGHVGLDARVRDSVYEKKKKFRGTFGTPLAASALARRLPASRGGGHGPQGAAAPERMHATAVPKP